MYWFILLSVPLQAAAICHLAAVKWLNTVSYSQKHYIVNASIIGLSVYLVLSWQFIGILIIMAILPLLRV